MRIRCLLFVFSVVVFLPAAAEDLKSKSVQISVYRSLLASKAFKADSGDLRSMPPLPSKMQHHLDDE